MKRTVLVVLVLLLLAASAFADRPWAPGAKGPGTQTSGFSMPPLTLRIGPSFASANWDRDDDNSKPVDVSLSGLLLEIGIRPLRTPVTSRTNFVLEVPLAFSLLQGKTRSGDETDVVLLGRGIPTARIEYDLTDKMVLSPHVGFGAGSQLSIAGGGVAADFHLVWVFRFGADLSLTKKLGVGVAILQNTFDYDYGSVYNSSTMQWNELQSNRKLSEVILSLNFQL